VRVGRGLVVAAALVVIVVGLRGAAGLLGPVALALVLVVAVSPVQRFLHRQGWPRWLGTLVLIGALYGLLAAMAGVLVLSVGEMSAELPKYAAQARHAATGVAGWLDSVGVTAAQARQIASALEPTRIVDLAAGLVGSIVSLLSDLVFLLALLLFMGVEAAAYPERMADLGARRPEIVTALREFAAGTRRYLLVATVFGAIVAALDGIALWALAVPLPVLWALLSFITNYIPNVGFVIGLVPPAVLALLAGGPWRMVWVIVLYCVINFVLQSLVQPKVVGDSVDLSITVTFLALVFWTWVLGGLGAILAIPLTLLAKALLVDAAEQTRWAASLLSARPGPAPVRPDQSG
jgi:AI-2 transport protein TqsA